MKANYMLAVFFTLSILFHCVSSEQLSFSNTFGNNMVLQREPSSANVYGFATPQDSIKVTFNGNTYTATADSNGQWLVTFPPTPSSGPYTITATGASSGTASISNVLFGDVYICSGQSNMQFTVNMAFNATQEIEDANNYPQIRLFTVGQNNISSVPMNNLISFIQPWSVGSSKSVAGGGYFSAVCWFYGKYLADTFPGLNIGLISSNWGGTIIQAWSSPVALAKCNITARDTEKYVEQMGEGQEETTLLEFTRPFPNKNSLLWNAMIYPFLKQSISGVLWYQAEANSGQPDLYSCMFPAMINDWRTNFGSVFPFYFVQLSSWITSSTTVAPTRQAQLSALKLPKVGFATAMDLGDPRPTGSIHPRDKQDVSKRLLSAALSISYDKPNPSYPPPFLLSATSSIVNNTYSYQLTFTVPSTDHLVFVNNVCPTGVPTSICQNFAFLLSDGKLYPATSVTITGYNTVSVSVSNAPSGLSVSGLQYCYSPWPVATLYNSEGQPVIPFFYQ